MPISQETDIVEYARTVLESPMHGVCIPMDLEEKSQ